MFPPLDLLLDAICSIETHLRPSFCTHLEAHSTTLLPLEAHVGLILSHFCLILASFRSHAGLTFGAMCVRAGGEPVKMMLCVNQETYRDGKAAKMRPGKVAAQCGHATLGCYVSASHLPLPVIYGETLIDCLRV